MKLKPLIAATVLLSLRSESLYAQVSVPSPPLVIAADKGDVMTVSRLLSSGSDVNAVNGDGETALMLAAQEDRDDITKLLLTKGAKVNAKNHTDQTALIYAAGMGRTDNVKELLGAGGDWRIKDKEGFDAFLLTTYTGNPQVVKIFLDLGADVNEANPLDKRTPLILAAESGSTAVVQELISAHADINATEGHGHTALASAIAEHKGAVADLLLSSGAKLSQQDESLLFKAAATGDSDLLSKLISAGADVRVKTASGQTPLIIAPNPGISDKQSAEVALMLIKAGADVNARDAHGMTALLGAIICGKPDTTRVLVAHGADTTAQVLTGKPTPLMQAVDTPNPFPGADQIGTLRALLAGRPNLEASDDAGRTALMVAAARGTAAIVTLLLANGAKINAQDTAGKTALMRSAQQGQIEITKTLLSHEADVNVKDHRGRTALDWTSGPIESTRTVFTVTKPGEAPVPPPSGLDADDKQQLATIERDRLIVARLLKQSGAKQ